MKYVLEFGRRDGQHADNVILPNRKLAVQLAQNLERVFTGCPLASISWEYRGAPRLVWQSPTRFIAISKLDGKDRGPASGLLWRRAGEKSFADFAVQVMS